jgi:hypothetical protein
MSRATPQAASKAHWIDCNRISRRALRCAKAEGTLKDCVVRMPDNGRAYPISASLVSESKPDFQSSFDLEHLIRIVITF